MLKQLFTDQVDYDPRTVPVPDLQIVPVTPEIRDSEQEIRDAIIRQGILENPNLWRDIWRKPERTPVIN